MILIVSGFPHGHFRIHVPRQEQRFAKRLPCTWLREDWFLQRLGSRSELASTRGRTEHKACCAVLVGAGTVNEGPLTLWEDEETQHEYGTM